MRSFSESRPQYASFRGMRTFSSLDGLRCASILAVIYYHAHGALDLGRIGTRGFLGVDLFFVISGFLIVTLLLREQERTGTLSWRRFMARRALRIFPLYYGVILVLLVVHAWIRPGGSQARAYFAELPQTLTYTTNWVPATTVLAVSWSLAAEEQFYLIWPPIQKYVKHALFVVLALLLVSQSIQFGVLDAPLQRWFGWGPKDPHMLRQTTFTPILLGVLLAYVLHRERSFGFAALILGHRASPFLFIALLVAGFLFLPDDITGWPRLAIQLGFMALVGACVVREDHWLAPLCRWRPVARIGALSYGLYLLHLFAMDPAMRMVQRQWLHPLLLFPVTLLGSYLIAEVSYRLYESRFLALKRGFTH